MHAMTVDFSQLFMLRNPMSTRAFACTSDLSVQVGWSYQRAEALPSGPVIVHWVQGAKVPGAVIRCGVNGVVVSEHVLEVLTGAGLRGWSTFPVEVYDGAGRHVPGFAGLSFTGRCGVIDLTRSVIVLVKMPGGWFPRFEGHYFDPASWDGSDLFMERPRRDGGVSAHTFCSSRARQVLRRARISNFMYEPLDRCQSWPSSYSGGLAHLLPPDIAERVREAYTRAGVDMPASVARDL